jgi:4-alpha-glucanotransferase
MDYLGCLDSQGINWSLIRLVFSSIANQAVIPLQDILGLDTQGRMNFPGEAEGNWNWRYRKDLLTLSIGNYLKELTYIYGRASFL